MRYIPFVLSVLGVLVVGCEKKEEAPVTPAAAVSKAEVTAVPTAATEPSQAPPTASPAVADATRAAAEPQVAAPATAPTTVEARSNLELAMQYIKDRKFDLADKLLAELDAQKSSLPASLQDQIARAQAALKTAKAASGASDAVGGIKLPSFGK